MHFVRTAGLIPKGEKQYIYFSPSYRNTSTAYASGSLRHCTYSKIEWFILLANKSISGLNWNLCVALEYVFSSNFRILPQCFYFQSLTDIFPVYVYFYVKPNSWFLFLFHFTLMIYSPLVFGHTTQLLLNSLLIGCVYFAYLKGKKKLKWPLPSILRNSGSSLQIELTT